MNRLENLLASFENEARTTGIFSSSKRQALVDLKLCLAVIDSSVHPKHRCPADAFCFGWRDVAIEGLCERGVAIQLRPGETSSAADPKSKPRAVLEVVYWRHEPATNLPVSTVQQFDAELLKNMGLGGAIEALASLNGSRTVIFDARDKEHFELMISRTATNRSPAWARLVDQCR